MGTKFHALVLVLVLVSNLVFLESVCALHAFEPVDDDAVVVEREDVCVVGRDAVEARYCAHLSLKDIGTGEGFLRHLSWLRLENNHALLQGDAVGPLGTRMVISVKNAPADSNDTSHAPSSRTELLTMDLTRMEVLLKEIVGGEAIGWARSGPLDVDARVIRSPFKTMVLQGGVGLGPEMKRLVPKSFEDFIPEISAKGGEPVPSTLGLWHWLPGTGLQRHDSWPSFFSLLGVPSSNPKVEKRRSFLPNWLATRAPLWAQELSSSQWQVHQRSLTLVSPQDKRKSLSLTYCESALASSPPKCTLETVAERNFDHPENSKLRVKLESKDVATCALSGSEAEGLWVLQDFQRKLVGSGAHRSLISVVTVSSSSEVQRMSETCRLRLVERLPTGIYADQFELQGIRRRGGFMEARIYGDVNLEQPALLSAQSILDVHVALLQVESDGKNGSASSLQAEVTLPLHARYPPLSVDSHSVVHIPMPHMLVSCQDVQEDDIILPVTEQWKEVSLGNVREPETLPRVLDWMVPAGNPADYSFVARFTAIAALSGVLVVFAASVAAEQRT